MSLPFVSFLCPTFGRPPEEIQLLNEKVFWFSQQDYPKHLLELVIVTDAPGQMLVCNVRGVRIIHHPVKIATLGDKRNVLIGHAKGDVLLVDDDDDISLPGRAAQAADKLSDADWYDPGCRWFQPGKFDSLVMDDKNCTHHACAYRKLPSIVYPSITKEEDQWISSWARSESHKRNLRGKFERLDDPKKLQYIYRWGVSRNHLSGKSNMQADWDNRPARPGTFEIVPVMYRNYVQEIKNHS